MRVVYLLVGRLGICFGEITQLAVLEQARTDRAKTHLAPGELVAGIAIAAILAIAWRIVGEAQSEAGLRQGFSLLPVAEELPVGRVFDGAPFARLDVLADRLLRIVPMLRALFHRLIGHKAKLPVRGSGRERRFDDRLDARWINGRQLLG